MKGILDCWAPLLFIVCSVWNLFSLHSSGFMKYKRKTFLSAAWHFKKHLILFFFLPEPSNRFCQVCDGSSGYGYSGITIAVHYGETKIRCSLRCRSLPECQLASYSETTRTCTLMTNVTQSCTERTGDIQMMDENDIDPIIPTTAATTTESQINDTASTESSTNSTRVASMSSSGVTTSESASAALTFASVTGMTSTSTASTTATGMGSTPTSTAQTTWSTSGHPWIAALTYNSSQNGTQVNEMGNFMTYGQGGSDLNLLVSTSNSQISMTIDWFKISWYPNDVCLKNFAFYVHSYSKPRKSTNTLCASSTKLIEFAWPDSGSTITVDTTALESVSIFTRDFSGKYHFALGSIGDIGYVRDILRGGEDIRFYVNDNELYSADIVYFGNGTNAVFALARRYAIADVANATLEFAHILHTIYSTIFITVETLVTNQDGDISVTTGNSANTEIYLQSNWTKVYEVADNGNVTHGTYRTLQIAVRQGHRVKILVGDEFIAFPDYIIEVAEEARILAVILDEFLQSNGSFTTQEGGEYRKLWREFDTNGSEKRCLLDTKDDPQGGDTWLNVTVAWFVDTAPWSTYYINSDPSRDTSSLKQAIEYGSRVRLMYQVSSSPDVMRVFIDSPVVTITGSDVKAKTPTLLDYDFSAGASMFSGGPKYLHFEFSTNGAATKYEIDVGRPGTDSASTLVSYYDVTWFTDQVTGWWTSPRENMSKWRID